MKLIHHITIRLSIILSIVLSIWALFFYFSIIDEINDETDDTLEDYSEQLIRRQLAGVELPSESSNSNNQFYLRRISQEEATRRAHIEYKDSMVYIPFKQETEPARILTTIFKDQSGDYFELVVSIPTIEKEDLKEAILYWVIFLYVTLLLCILSINIWVYQQSNRPLHKLLTWVNKYKIGTNNTTLNNPTNISEYKKLNEAIVKSMERNEEIFNEQKQFIGNASHEMQTPLAVCANRIESLMEDETLSQAHLEELLKTLQTLEHIARLNKTLLLLSKIENKQFPANQSITLNEIIKQHIVNYSEVYAHKNIEVKIEETNRFTVEMNEVLADILVSNLLKNAFIHNIPEGKIKVIVSENRLICKNTGNDGPLDAQLIFKRFYQKSQKPGSSGLGLSLSKSICDQQNLHIEYSFVDNFHCFEVHI